jgi:hypothetical protein
MKREQRKLIVENPSEVPVKVIAESIVDIAGAMRRINETRLTREAIVALIHDRSRVQKGIIHLVLNNLDQLEENWLKKRPT